MLDRASILFPVVALATLTFAVLMIYVALRLAHSAIHVTYNRVRHRLFAFAASNLVLISLWTNLLRNLSA